MAQRSSSICGFAGVALSLVVACSAASNDEPKDPPSSGGSAGTGAGTGGTGAQGTSASGGIGGTADSGSASAGTGGTDAGVAGSGGLGGGGGLAGTGAGAGGTGGSAGTAGGPPQCRGLAQATPPFTPVLRVPLRVHRTRSALSDADLCAVLEEVNQIWWSQAAICFEVEAIRTDAAASVGLDLWFERSSPFPNGVDANGVYGGPHEIYSLDRPSLASAPNPVTNLPARTAAHELGHALNLSHQDCGTACDDLLMRSGRRGFQVATGAPASVDERARARARATSLALNDTAPNVCSPPKILE